MSADFAEFDLLDERPNAEIVMALADLLQVATECFLPQDDFWAGSLDATRAVAFEASRFADGARVFVRLTGNFDLPPVAGLGHALCLKLRTPVVVGDEGRRPPGAVLVFYPEGRVEEGIEIPSGGGGHKFELLDEVDLRRVPGLDDAAGPMSGQFCDPTL
ncbi:hypothetical protein ACQ86G_15810 [Roseateles chitinivorans]|uniref:hypothetical protein n=1 Tax=Roseateles chitinivorans TaxID=2917965 RepID=UPI003D671339